MEAASYAVDVFHPELELSEDQSRADLDKRESVVRRYQEAYYTQRRAIPERYLELLEFGDEERIVAEFLASVFERTGMPVNKAVIRDAVFNSGEEFMLALENDLDSRTRK